MIDVIANKIHILGTLDSEKLKTKCVVVTGKVRGADGCTQLSLTNFFNKPVS
ncbi:MAG: hypothetical protein Q9M91_08535 [Candidatus Dojkabacteria bacterium]|nr:hypothetical protein [Candidatus Dojkabacteria bacterium]